MTVIAPVIQAFYRTSPNRELSLLSGTVTMDAGRAPLISANITIAQPDAETMDDLDPRFSPVVFIRVSSIGDGGGPREFHLGVRNREPVHEDGTVALELASDEKRLEDFAPLVDDWSPLSMASLRDVVEHVLTSVPSVAPLLLPGTLDPDVTPYYSARNLHLDPGTAGTGSGVFAPGSSTLDITDTSWSISGDGDCLLIGSPTNADSFAVNAASSGMVFGVQGGKTYVVSATGNVKTALSGTISNRSRRIVVFYRSGANGAYTEVQSAAVPNTVNTPTRVSVQFSLPEGTTECFIRYYLGATAGQIRWDGFRLSERGPGLLSDDALYFDGDTANTSHYVYTWEGTQDASPSVRTPVVERSPEALIWRAGQSGIDFLQPLLQASGLRLLCLENQWPTLRNEEHAEPGSLTLRQGVNLISASDLISRDSGLWFDARVTRYKWTREGVEQERIDSYGLPGYTRLTTLDLTTPYPGPGRSEYAVRRAQQRGREVTVSTAANWRATTEQPVEIRLDSAPIQRGLTQSVSWDLESNEMTVTARTTDIPAGAVDLLAGTVNSLTGTVNAQ